MNGGGIEGDRYFKLQKLVTRYLTFIFYWQILLRSAKPLLVIERLYKE